MSTGREAEMENLKKLFPFESKFFEIGKHKLHYIDEGTGNLLVLFHACPMWSFFFRDIIREFSSRYRVIAVDQMGFGLSDKPADYDYRIENHIDNFERFADALGLRDMTLIMHGRGTTIGMGYAVKHPANIRAFMTLNSMAFSDYALPWRLQICRIRWLGAKIIMGLRLFQLDARKLPKEIQAAYDYPFPDDASRIAMLRFIEDIPCVPEDASAQSMFEIESGLWLLRDRPASIVWAMKDWLYRTKNLAKWCQYFPEAELHMIERAGRYVAEDAPAELSHHIQSFLTRNRI